MVIEKNTQDNLPGIGHYLVQHLQAIQTPQVGILAEINTVGQAAGIE